MIVTCLLNSCLHKVYPDLPFYITLIYHALCLYIYVLFSIFLSPSWIGVSLIYLLCTRVVPFVLLIKLTKMMNFASCMYL